MQIHRTTTGRARLWSATMGPSPISITCWTVCTTIPKQQDDSPRWTRTKQRNLTEFIRINDRSARISPKAKSSNVHRKTPSSIAITPANRCRSSMNISTKWWNKRFHSTRIERCQRAVKDKNVRIELLIRFSSSLDTRTSSYAYPGMMSSSTGFWPNFMTSPASYPHPTYLPTSQTEYTDWMHHHPSYRSTYSTTPSSAVSASTSVSVGTSNMSNNHLHPIESPTNSSRYHHHHSTSDMDVVTAAAIGAAAAAQMFHEKQSHHGYTGGSHFDYHLGSSMIPSASYAFPSQSKDASFLCRTLDFSPSFVFRFRSDEFGVVDHASGQFEHEGRHLIERLVFESSFILLIIEEKQNNLHFFFSLRLRFLFSFYLLFV